MDKQNELIINDECFVVKLSNKLIVNRKYIRTSKTYRNLVLVFIIPMLIMFLISISFEFISGLQALIITIIMVIPFIILYFLYKIRKVKWYIDKESQKASYIRVSPRYKLLKKLKFSEIKYLLYRPYKKADPALSPKAYSLHFYTEKLPDPIIYYGGEKDCQKLGLAVADFIGKSLYYSNGEWKEEIFNSVLGMK